MCILPQRYTQLALRRRVRRRAMESVGGCAHHVYGMYSGACDGERERVRLPCARHVLRRAMESVGGCAFHVPGMYSGVRRRAWGVLTMCQACNTDAGVRRRAWGVGV